MRTSSGPSPNFLDGNDMDWGTQSKNEWHQPAESGSGAPDVLEPVEINGVPIPDKAGTSHEDSPETCRKNCNWV